MGKYILMVIKSFSIILDRLSAYEYEVQLVEINNPLILLFLKSLGQNDDLLPVFF